MSQLITGEAVALDLRPAKVGSRLIGGLLDLAVLFGLLVAVNVLVLTAFLRLDGAFASAIALVLVIGVLVGYPVALETFWRGRTLGKAAMGLRVVRDDGGPIRFRHALIRGLVGFFEKYATFGVVAVLSSAISTQGKRLGDQLAGTVVLQERTGQQLTLPLEMPPALAGWARSLDLAGLSEELALRARQFLGRAAQLHPGAREQLGSQLVAEVAAAVRPASPPGVPGWAYLAAVLAERRRRELERYGPPAPAPGYGQPGPAYGQPGPAHSQPGPAYGQPGPAHSQPGSGYGPPPAGYAPAGYGQPGFGPDAQAPLPGVGPVASRGSASWPAPQPSQDEDRPAPPFQPPG